MGNAARAPEGGITDHLVRWSDGEREAFDALVPLVEAELRRIARRSLRSERANHTLQPTALVNEAWLRLEAERSMRWRDRGHFFAVAAQLMRFILVDYARRRHTAKRGREAQHVLLAAAFDVPAPEAAGLVEVDAALTRLEQVDQRKARVATLRLFAGATVDETARALGVAGITVMRDWRFARAWLARELRG
jgi:RNA polymerase sigma-70 factor, ECF subfamily